MEDWLAFAQRLKEGTHKKTSHDCGPGDCRIVSHKRDGWGWSCFRCDGKGWVPRPAESLAEKLARAQRVQAVERSAMFSVSLPSPAVYEPHLWPLAARVWLYKAGISNVEIGALGIYWNPRLERVVLPVLDAGNEPVYWQARTLDKSNTRKYLNPNVDKDKLVARFGLGAAIVLTEDYLSAYRVSRAGYEAWSLLGTKLSTHVATELIKRKLPVVVLLDPDGAGRKAASRIVSTLRSFGVSAFNGLMERDPKLHTKDEIRTYLSQFAPDA